MDKHEKSVILRIGLIALTVALMGLIFYLSADSAETSSAKSDVLADSFAVNVLKMFHLNEKQAEFILSKSVFIVRKAAHFSEYAALGFLLCAVCTSFYVTNKNRFLISQGIASLYAVSDEVHQFFVPGRSCQLRDVIIDSIGACTGILLLMLIFFLYLKIKTDKKGRSQKS